MDAVGLLLSLPQSDLELPGGRAYVRLGLSHPVTPSAWYTVGTQQMLRTILMNEPQTFRLSSLKNHQFQ